MITLAATAIVVLTAASAGAVTGQTATGVTLEDTLRSPARDPAGGQRSRSSGSWRARWDARLVTTYDDNVFGLSPSQLRRLEAGRDRYADMNAAHDILSSVRVRAGLRGPGLTSQRLDVLADARFDHYAISPRQSRFRLGLLVRQRLSERDRLRADIDIAPGEFRRNYLGGVDETGAPVYIAGTQTTAGGAIGYERALWSADKAQLSGMARVMASRRTVADLPWRDRHELGGAVRLDLRMGTADLQLNAGRSRASHPDEPEPVRLDDQVIWSTLGRDFGLTSLGVAGSLRLSDEASVGASYGHRTRQYLASLAEDPVYGDRSDRGEIVGVELRLRVSSRVDLQLGGSLQRQFTFRPGRGDTGDEASYTRRTTTLRVDYSR
jgi:hypothetical protein